MGRRRRKGSRKGVNGEIVKKTKVKEVKGSRKIKTERKRWKRNWL
jgi:hypothetical protein